VIGEKVIGSVGSVGSVGRQGDKEDKEDKGEWRIFTTELVQTLHCNVSTTPELLNSCTDVAVQHLYHY
jgi:hypothetical protein